MKIHSILIAELICVLGATALPAQCTPESARSRQLAVEFATEPARPTRPAGVPVVAASQVRLLTDATGDGARCQQLRSAFESQRRQPWTGMSGYHISYYAVGTLYYVVAHVKTPVTSSGSTVTLRLRWSPIVIVDQQNQVIATVGR